MLSKATPNETSTLTRTRSLSTIYSSRYSFKPAFVTGGIGTGFLTATTKPSIVFCPLRAKHGQSYDIGLTFYGDLLVFGFDIFWCAGLRFDAFGLANFEISSIMKPRAHQFR